MNAIEVIQCSSCSAPEEDMSVCCNAETFYRCNECGEDFYEKAEAEACCVEEENEAEDDDA